MAPQLPHAGYYYYDETGRKAKTLLITLNELGAQGWRATALERESYILERELPN